MIMGITIKFKLDEYKKAKEILEYLTKHKIRIGFIGNETGEHGTKVSEYAFYVEFGKGKGNIPRPFFRNATKEIQEMLNEKLKPLIMEAIKSKANGEVVLNTIGIEAVGLIQKSINEGIYAPNKESTLKHKKGSKPLIDTGTMLQSVNFKIEGV